MMLYYCRLMYLAVCRVFEISPTLTSGNIVDAYTLTLLLLNFVANVHLLK